MSNRTIYRAALSAALTSWSTISFAQVSGDTDELPEESPPISADTDDAASNKASSEEPTTGAANDGTRFRFGVAGGGGLMLWNGYTFNYGGVDLRFGAQISDELAIYAQPQLGIYVENINGISATGGLFGASVLAEYTFIDRFFVGAGPGFAVLNNPSGSSCI